MAIVAHEMLARSLLKPVLSVKIGAKFLVITWLASAFLTVHALMQSGISSSNQSGASHNQEKDKRLDDSSADDQTYRRYPGLE